MGSTCARRGRPTGLPAGFRFIYAEPWTSSGGLPIQRFNLDGTNRFQLPTTGLLLPNGQVRDWQGIGVNPATGTVGCRSMCGGWRWGSREGRCVWWCVEGDRLLPSCQFVLNCSLSLPP